MPKRTFPAAMHAQKIVKEQSTVSLNLGININNPAMSKQIASTDKNIFMLVSLSKRDVNCRGRKIRPLRC
jgi:hypothetical protein